MFEIKGNMYAYTSMCTCMCELGVEIVKLYKMDRLKPNKTNVPFDIW